MQQQIKVLLIAYAAQVEKLGSPAILPAEFDSLSLELEQLFHKHSVSGSVELPIEKLKRAYYAGVNDERAARRMQEANEPHRRPSFDDWLNSEPNATDR